MNGPYTPALHDWGPPMVGQGPAPICRVCGARKTVATPADCPGRDMANVVDMLPDYDPLKVADTEHG